MIEILVIFALILLNGVFAMSEIAVVSARKVRLRQASEAGDLRARAALELAENPNRFLSTVQVGITLIGVLAGAYGGATISARLEPTFRAYPLLAPYSSELAFGLVVAVITYLSLVFGELVPKHLALRSPERIAGAVSSPMRILSIVGRPLVAVLSASTELVIRLMGSRQSEELPVTEEEIALLLTEGAQAGVIEEAEQDMIERVFRFGDQSASAVMTPRTEIECLNIDDEPERIREKIASHPHTRFIVCRGGLDDPVGIVHVKDLLAQFVTSGRLDIHAALRQPPFVPASLPALRVLEQFKKTGEHLAIVVDEYGGVAGLVTLDDILEAIVGGIPWSGEELEPDAVQREDGSWLVEGMMPVDDFKDLFEIRELPGEESHSFHTVGGFVVTFLGRIPTASDHFVWKDLYLEVVDMDGKRIDKVLVRREPSPDAVEEA